MNACSMFSLYIFLVWYICFLISILIRYKFHLNIIIDFVFTMYMAAYGSPEKKSQSASDDYEKSISLLQEKHVGCIVKTRLVM